MRQVMNLMKASIGQGGFKIVISLLLLVSGSIFLVFIIKSGISRIRKIIFFVLVATGLVLTWQIEIIEERVHLLEFAVLGWLALRDTARVKKAAKAFWLAISFTFLIGVLDEGFQAVLPYRYFQTWDILLNSLGRLWGITLFSLFNKIR